MNTSVLVVDDSLTIRMDLTEALIGAGLNAVACSTVAEARGALAQEQFPLIILDVLLPDGDGVELLKEIRGTPCHKGTAVMLLSTEAEVRDRVRGLTTGADEYIGKPYDTSYVVARARELLRRGQPVTAPPQKTILVIDDSATFREELRHALEVASYHVLTADTGDEGLRVAADARPTAIIVDGVLPGIDGATVIRRIRLDTALRRTPCLLLTASEDRNAEVRALEAGADAFVRKEEDIAFILARLSAVLRSAGTQMRNESTASLTGPKKILAVDDSQTYLHEISGALRGEGYEVALAHSGEEALELLAVQPMDCILLDLLMPGIGGQETCLRIKSAPAMRDIPLVMVTALEDREAVIEGLSAGADDFIAKSSDFQVLKARVHAQIRRKQFEDENRRISEDILKKEMQAADARAARDLAGTRATLLEDLKRKNQELEAFSYSVSHDLRTPLRSIDGFSQLLLRDYADKIDERGQDFLRLMHSASQRMGELIDDLLELSRLGRLEMRRERVDLSALARLVAGKLQMIEPERTIQLVIEEGIVAEGDPRLLRVVLENLLGNAWKFTAKSDQQRVEFGATQKDGQVTYFVQDSGAGFDMAYANKLFKPFQRLHSEADFAGTGIGLATVQRVIERHGGRVWAESAVHQGTTFFWTVSAN
jgi:two-component system, NtrC family, sensor kinase